MRTCCIPGCKTGVRAPRHTFPMDAERRKKWFQGLYMEPLQDENEIKKLRICYRHFRDEDYTCSPVKRVLSKIAVPSLNLPQHGAELVDNVDCNNHVEQHKEQKITLHDHSYMNVQEQDEKVLIKHELVPQHVVDNVDRNNYVEQHKKQKTHEHSCMNMQGKHEKVLVKHELLPQHTVELVDDVDCNNDVEQHKEQKTLDEHSSMTVQDNFEEILAKHELKFQEVMQMQEIIRQQQQRIENIEKTLKMQSKAQNVRDN